MLATRKRHHAPTQRRHCLIISVIARYEANSTPSKDCFVPRNDGTLMSVHNDGNLMSVRNDSTLMSDHNDVTRMCTRKY
ncbi:MAG: hypothetical protein JSS98_11065 [Bacteroidetes bacterium]|nr:hypothetical protein [Bacteroidota bacterium]